MEDKEPVVITVTATIAAPVSYVWERWTRPEHIVNWNNASDDWCTPRASNDLRVGGKFNYRMEARDGSMGFDFEGTYTGVLPEKSIEYVLGDGRKVKIVFTSAAGSTEITEFFDAENEHSPEMQRAGWQAILDNFKKYTEKK